MANDFPQLPKMLEGKNGSRIPVRIEWIRVCPIRPVPGNGECSLRGSLKNQRIVA